MGNANSMTCARAMVHCLELEGITTIFGYPGAAICPFYDELLSSNIEHILVRHEANAGHAANGYARMTSRPAVCVATSGPGATNLITAIATAYMDSVPMVVITGQVSSDLIGRDVFQEADITGAAEPFVKHSYLVKNAQELPKVFKEAFYIAGTGRPGPVLIDIPIDIQRTEINFSYPESVDIRSYKPTTRGNALQIKRVAQAIDAAHRPVICAGGGVFISSARESLERIAIQCDIPVISTLMGVGVLPTNHPLNFGMVGMHGARSANIAINDSDLLIIVGARVGDRAITTPNVLEKRTKIVHIDIDPAEIGKNLDTAIPVVGDAQIILTQLLERVKPSKHEEWINRLRSISPSQRKLDYDGIEPHEFIRTLSQALPKDSICVADVGQNQIWSASSFEINGGRFLTSGGMGTMGYSVPAAIGAKLADKNRTVVAICGDGSFQMQMMELATMCQHDVPIKIVVMKNNRLGMVNDLQKQQYDGRTCAVNLDGSPDFVMLAKAYGIPAISIDHHEQFESAISAMVEAKTPFLMEVIISPDIPTL